MNRFESGSPLDRPEPDDEQLPEEVIADIELQGALIEALDEVLPLVYPPDPDLEERLRERIQQYIDSKKWPG